MLALMAYGVASFGQTPLPITPPNALMAYSPSGAPGGPWNDLTLAPGTQALFQTPTVVYGMAYKGTDGNYYACTLALCFGGGGGGGATLPFPGIVYATSASGGTVATSAQIQSAIGSNIYAPYSATAPVTGSGVAFGPAYWSTTTTVGGIASPITGTLWWLGTSAAPRASTTSDTAALSISGNSATVTTINSLLTAGTNTGLSGAGTSGSPYSFSVTALPTTALTGPLQAAQEPAHTGDVTNTAGSLALTIAAIQGNTVSGTTGTGNVAFSASPIFTGTVTAPIIQGVTSGNGSISLNCGQGTTAAANFCLLQPSPANVGGFLNITYGKGGSPTAGTIGQTVAAINSQPEATTNYYNSIERAVVNVSNTHVQTQLEFGVEGGMDAAGNQVAVTGTTYGTVHTYCFDNFNSLTWCSYQPNFTITSATTNGTTTVAYAGSQAGMVVGQKLVPSTVLGIPASTTIATLTPGTGFTMSQSATQSATGNVYVTSPLLTFGQKTQFTGGLSVNSFSTTTNCNSAASPAVCGSAPNGSILIPTGTTSSTLTVNDTLVTSASQIWFYPDDSLGTRLGVTCNTTLATLVGGSFISARTPGTSFQITFNGSILTNGVCGSFGIIN